MIDQIQFNTSHKQIGEHLIVDGIPRPVTNSRDRRIASTDEAITNFWRWYGTSKLLDSFGRPIVVFHGTSSKVDFHEFAPSSEFSLIGRGIQFSSSSQDASKYASTDIMVNHDYVGKAELMSQRYSMSYLEAKETMNGPSRVIPAYLMILKPFVIGERKIETTASVFRLAAIESDVDEDDIARLWRRFQKASTGFAQWEVCEKVPKIFRQIASIQGFDGLVLSPEVAPLAKGASHFIVFHPEQIKSAVGNTGLFMKNTRSFCDMEPMSLLNIPTQTLSGDRKMRL